MRFVGGQYEQGTSTKTCLYMVIRHFPQQEGSPSVLGSTNVPTGIKRSIGCFGLASHFTSLGTSLPHKKDVKSHLCN